MAKLRVNTDAKAFEARTLDLDDGLDPLLPVPHPHVGKRKLDRAAAELELTMKTLLISSRPELQWRDP